MFEKPFPVQRPTTVAKKMVRGIEKGKKSVSPCPLFAIGKALMTVIPFDALYIAYPGIAIWPIALMVNAWWPSLPFKC